MVSLRQYMTPRSKVSIADQTNALLPCGQPSSAGFANSAKEPSAAAQAGVAGAGVAGGGGWVAVGSGVATDCCVGVWVGALTVAVGVASASATVATTSAMTPKGVRGIVGVGDGGGSRRLSVK